MVLFEEPLVHLIGRRADSSDQLQPGLQVATEPPRGNRQANAQEKYDGQRQCHDDQLLA